MREISVEIFKFFNTLSVDLGGTIGLIFHPDSIQSIFSVVKRTKVLGKQRRMVSADASETAVIMARLPKGEKILPNVVLCIDRVNMEKYEA